MLTTSPVITSPNPTKNVSPRSFHYVPARTPQGSPPLPSSSRTSRQSSTISQSPKSTTTSLTARTASALMSSPSDIARAPAPQENAGVDSPSGVAPPTRNSSTQPTDSSDPQLVAVHRPPNNTNSQSSAATPPKKTPSSKRRPNSPEPAAGAPPGDSSRVPQAANPQDQARPAQRHRALPADPKALPLAYEHCAVSDMVVLIAHMLSELIETNDGLALRSGSLTRFHSRTAPGISVLDYLNRLAHHATLSPPLLLSMVYYIDRLCALYPEFTINTLTVHRFLITAATVAAKGLSDSFWNNATYAKVGGVRVAELKLLELEFLYRVDWRIVPNPDVLVAYYKGLVERCPGYALESSTVNSPIENNRPDSLATVAANGEASNTPVESPKGQNGDS